MIDDVLSVNVGDLYTQGAPRDGAPFVLRGRDQWGSVMIQITGHDDGVSYEGRRDIEPGRTCSVAGEVSVDWEAANLGGERAAFVCRCGRRARRLFLVGGVFVCRRCARVRYASRRRPADPRERRLERITEIRCRLDRPGEWDDPVPPRPKGMHERTYERDLLALRELIRQEEVWVNAAINRGELSLRQEFARVLARELRARRHADRGAA